MADTSNLSEFLTDIADAIRTKKETTEEIPAVNFDTEILSIETGIDTSDATATSKDIINPKTAYVNGVRVTGSIMPVYEESNPKLIDTGLMYSLASNEYACFTFTSDRTHFVNFNTTGDIILRDANGAEYDRKNITAYGGTSAEVPYRVATSNVLNADGNSYVGLVTKNSKNVYFYVFEINHKTHKLSDYYSREATSYAYLDTGMNVCFANLRADIVVFYSDSKNTAGYTAKIRQINQDCSMSIKSSYYNTNLYWVTNMSFNADDTILTYNLSHGQDAGNGFIFAIKDYAFAGVLRNASRTTYTILNDKFLLQRVYNQTPVLAEYTISGTTMTLGSTTSVSTVVQLKGEGGVRNNDVSVLKDNYFTINYGGTLYLYHLEEDTKTITQISSKSVSYVCAEYNNVVYTVSTNMYDRYISTDAELVGFNRDSVDFYNTSSADALASDIVSGKVAYNASGKVIGTVLERDSSTGGQYTIDDTMTESSYSNKDYVVAFSQDMNIQQDTLVRAGSTWDIWVNQSAIADAINLTSEKITKGNTVLGIEGTAEAGTDTSDATATSTDIALGKTAYVNGEKINGEYVPDAKVYTSEELLKQDLLNKPGTVGVVYESELKTVKDVSYFTNVIFPNTVEITNTPTETEYGSCSPVGEGEYWMCDFNVSLSSTSVSIFWMIEGSEYIQGEVKYASTDGITYTRTSGPGSVELPMRFAANDSLTNDMAKFLAINSGNFNGLFGWNESDMFITAITSKGNKVYMPQYENWPDSTLYYDPSGDLVEVLETDSNNYVTRAKIINYLYYAGFCDINGFINLITSGSWGSLTCTEITFDILNKTYSVINTTTYNNSSTSSSTAIGVPTDITSDSEIFFGENVTYWSDPAHTTVIENGQIFSSGYDWNNLPTQFTLSNTNELAEGIVALGESGAITGDGTIIDTYNLVDIMTRYSGNDIRYNTTFKNTFNFDGINYDGYKRKVEPSYDTFLGKLNFTKIPGNYSVNSYGTFCYKSIGSYQYEVYKITDGVPELLTVVTTTTTPTFTANDKYWCFYHVTSLQVYYYYGNNTGLLNSGTITVASYSCSVGIYNNLLTVCNLATAPSNTIYRINMETGEQLNTVTFSTPTSKTGDYSRKFMHDKLLLWGNSYGEDTQFLSEFNVVSGEYKTLKSYTTASTSLYFIDGVTEIYVAVKYYNSSASKYETAIYNYNDLNTSLFTTTGIYLNTYTPYYMGTITSDYCYIFGNGTYIRTSVTEGKTITFADYSVVSPDGKTFTMKDEKSNLYVTVTVDFDYEGDTELRLVNTNYNNALARYKLDINQDLSNNTMTQEEYDIALETVNEILGEEV